ncbi:MAG: DUF488 domain-containing protein [Treponema sp.]|jgi:hypothetical protein|nr:DUF488 domain-containing protein [Treponema sp.]
MGSLFTIGSSIHAIDEFIAILHKYKINAVADVRSVPYSKHTPQFNVSKTLVENLGVNIEHILFDGSLKNHCDLEKEMLNESNTKHQQIY